MEKVALYLELLKPRIFEEQMLKLLRKGEISKWFSGIGQEAVSVGSALALKDYEYICTLHRNLGVFTARKVPYLDLLLQFQGREGSFTKGRDRSFHFGSSNYRIVGMISHLGAQLGVASGIGLSDKLRDTKAVTLVFSGDGGTSEGDFHESLNLAAVWDLPVIFLIENNGYGLSTPVVEQYRCSSLVDKAIGYGIEGVRIDGNDVTQVFETVRGFAEAIREHPRPVLIEAMTFRVRGHEEASGTAYVPKDLIESWQKRDPVIQCERELLEEGVIDLEFIESAKQKVESDIKQAIDSAKIAKKVSFSVETELSDVLPGAQLEASAELVQTSRRRFVDAIKDAHREALLNIPSCLVMGQDIAEYGGVFKITEGLVEEFGKARVRNTPLCESAVLGAALGLSIGGFTSIVEMQFADFVSCGFNQIVNNLAKIKYRWGHEAKVVVRLPCGGGVGAGPFHSQSPEAWFFHTPGLKIAYPAFPADAKGLLLESLFSPGPTLFFEHKFLYRRVEEQVPEGLYRLPFGKANVVREGEEVSIVTYGLGVHWALELAEKFKEVSLEIIDLRTLCPLDFESVKKSVIKTGKVLVLYEANRTGAVGAEVSARIGEELFDSLDAPVSRVGSLDTPIPFSKNLEEGYLAKAYLEEEFLSLIEY